MICLRMAGKEAKKFRDSCLRQKKNRIVNLWLLSLVRPMVLAEHPPVSVEDTLGVPHVLDVADRIEPGVGAQGRLARAPPAEHQTISVLRSISPWICSVSFCTVTEPSSKWFHGCSSPSYC